MKLVSGTSSREETWSRCQGDRGSEEAEGARRRRQQARPQRGGEEEQGGADIDYVLDILEENDN